MNRAVFAAAASLLLAACASTSHLIPEAPAGAQSAAAMPPPIPDATTLMVDGALAMLGQPYRYGGSAPGGFDCSGLVFYSAAAAGIRVPRTAAEQLNFGVAVGPADLRAGDLVFMHLSQKELHVAIALDEQRFIHAPSSGGFVRIDSLRASPYANGFIGARRIIKNGGTALSSSTPQ